MSQDISSISTGGAHRPLNRNDYKTLSLAALGGALEFYDFIIFVFLAAVVSQHFFPADIPDWLRQFQTYGIFAAGYLARPLGGIIMAHFGDLFGRKKMFNLSILLMAYALFLCMLAAILGFGLLALSQTQAIKVFGLTVLLGVIFSYFYANILTLPADEADEMERKHE